MGKRSLAALVICLLPALTQAVEIRSISPITATPGQQVTVVGGPFDPAIEIVLGEQVLQPDAVGQSRLSFTLPRIEAGAYSLFLRSGPNTSSRTFTLQVEAPAPRIDTVAPTNLDACSTPEEREITVSGRNFQSGASLLLAGKAVAYADLSESSLTFTLPDLDPGAYGVEVVNPDGKRTLPHSLYINNVPKIFSVSQGESFVNYYEMIIEGKNFSFNSKLVVHEDPSLSVGPSRPQRVIRSQGAASDQGGGTASGEGLNPRQTDSFTFQDCRTLIYYRYPYSAQPKDLSIQVVNPDGKASNVFAANLP